MKKAGIWVLMVSALCLCFVLGLFLGRLHSPSHVLLSHPPKQTQAAQSTDPSRPTLLININTADAQQLQQLPGIGPVTAQKIIAYRETHGPFETVSQLTMVDGIGITTLEKLLDYITVGGTYENSGC